MRLMAACPAGAGSFRQLLVQRAQALFGQFALGDVGVGADQAQGLALRIAADHHAMYQDPDPLAILVPHAHVQGVVCGATVQVGCTGGPHLGQIVGMRTREKLMLTRADSMVGVTSISFQRSEWV